MPNPESLIYHYPEGFLKAPQNIAWTDADGATYSFRQMTESTHWFVQELQQRGVKEHTRVILFVRPGFALACLLNAIYTLGATAVFIDPWLPKSKALSILSSLQGDVWMVAPEFNVLLTLLRPLLGKKKWVLKVVGAVHSDTWTIAPRDPSTTAFLSFTSGSTGKPKVVKRSYTFLGAQFVVAEKYWRGAVTTESSPFFVAMMAALRMGNAVVFPSFQNSKQDGASYYQQLCKHHAERIILAPHLWSQLLDQIASQGAPPKLKKVVIGGAPMSRHLIERTLNQQAAFDVQLVYGSTEVEPIALCSITEYAMATVDPANGIYAGKPIEEIRLKLIAPSAQPLTAHALKEQAEIGEVTVSGHHVCTEYYNSEADFKRNKIVDADGTIWHRTGDIGRLKDGHLFLLGRINRIMQKGINIYYPFPLELSVQEHTSLQTVGVVQTSGGTICCCIDGRESTLAATIDWRALATNHAWPFDEVVLLQDSLPMDERHQSKLNAAELLSQLAFPLKGRFRKKTLYI